MSKSVLRLAFQNMYAPNRSLVEWICLSNNCDSMSRIRGGGYLSRSIWPLRLLKSPVMGNFSELALATWPICCRLGRYGLGLTSRENRLRPHWVFSQRVSVPLITCGPVVTIWCLTLALEPEVSPLAWIDRWMDFSINTYIGLLLWFFFAVVWSRW